MNLRYFLSILISTIALTCHGEKMIVDAYSLYAFEEPSASSRLMYELGQGTEVDVLENDGEWAKINLKGKIRYVKSDCLIASQEMIDAGKVPAWKIPGPYHKSYQSVGWFFSTDRIMEAIPPINFLEGRIPFDPDKCFDIALYLLMITFVAMLFISGRIKYGNLLYWIFYVVSLVISVCELIYIFGSPDPLGYCDVENVSFLRALFYVFITGIALYQQLKLYSTIMFVTREDTDFNFWPGLGVKLMLLVTIYFIVSVIAYHFCHYIFPEYISWCAVGLLFIPTLKMLYEVIRTGRFGVFAAMLSFYVVMTAATLAMYCLVGIAIVMLMFVALLFHLATRDNTYYVQVNGIWYYCDYDTWLEGSRLGLWERWTYQ